MARAPPAPPGQDGAIKPVHNLRQVQRPSGALVSEQGQGLAAPARDAVLRQPTASAPVPKQRRGTAAPAGGAVMPQPPATTPVLRQGSGQLSAAAAPPAGQLNEL